MEDYERKSVWDNRQAEAKRFFQLKEKFDEHFDKWIGRSKSKHLEKCVLIERKSVRNLSGLITEKERKKLYNKLRTINKKIKIDPQSCAMELEKFHMELLDKLQSINLRLPQETKETTMVGYEAFGGIGWDPVRRWKNWQRTKINIENLAEQVRKKDKDTFIFIWGEKGLGKSTLALHLMDHISQEELSRENFIFNYEDFETVTDEQVSPFLIDELSNIFNRRRAMAKKNVKGLQIMDNIRYKNLVGFGCTIKFDRIDKQLIDHVDIGMEVIEEGKFKFYNREKLEKFKKTGGKWILPDCNWIGHFPEKKDEVWDNYKDMEPEKEVENGGETAKEEEEDTGPTKKDRILDELEDGKDPKEIAKENEDIDLQYARNIASSSKLNNNS